MNQILEIAERAKELRDILDITIEEMAEHTNVTVEKYKEFEKGKSDATISFLYKCAEAFGVDLSELLTGEKPKLTFYSIVRKGKGLPIIRRTNFNYNHLAHLMQERTCEPLFVTAPYSPLNEEGEIPLSQHEGQEFDYVLKGKLKIRLEDRYEVLNEGDSIYYNSSHGHGMVAVGGENCEFLAIVLKEMQE